MSQQEIDIRGTIPADQATVWRLLGDSATWPSWTPIDAFELERAGDTAGLGEIRAFTTGRVRVREQIVVRTPPRRLAYTLLSGLAVRDYRADIELEPGTSGTDIRWHTTFRPKVPGTGWVYRRALQKATQRFVDGLVAHAAEPAAR